MGQMNKFSALRAGHEGDKNKKEDRTPQGRRPIFVDTPPAHAGIVSALRTAFAVGSVAPHNDEDEDEFAALLSRIN